MDFARCVPNTSKESDVKGTRFRVPDFLPLGVGR